MPTDIHPLSNSPTLRGSYYKLNLMASGGQSANLSPSPSYKSIRKHGHTPGLLGNASNRNSPKNQKAGPSHSSLLRSPPNRIQQPASNRKNDVNSLVD